MKPIVLKIAGLHSFREEQEIPFAELSQLGVFGIFGPTGSGKSSILDAMTLALYGTVVRAGRRTQGILNHAEKHVKVSFTFSLGQGTLRQEYRVERRYTRKDQLAVNNTLSRLVLIKDGIEEVIADKDRDVTEQITGLLGLKEEDFTRAVVLPQGKFAEFLNLGGKERREMLQRLFSLEQYGNILINKVNDRYKITETKYIEVESEQKGLGNASSSDLEEAKTIETAAVKKDEEARAYFLAVEKMYNEAKEVYNVQLSLAKKQAEIELHRTQAERIRQVEAALQVAEKADRVAAVLEEFLSSQAMEEAAYKAKSEAAAAASSKRAEAEGLNATYTAARTSRQENEPRLVAECTKLEAALLLEQQTGELTEVKKRLELEQTEKQKVNVISSKSLAEQITKQQKLTEGIKELELRLTQAIVNPEARRLGAACTESAQVVMQAIAATDKIKQVGSLRKEEWEKAQTAARLAEDVLIKAEIRLGKLEEDEARAANEQLKAASEELDKLVSGEQMSSAVRLAKLLQEGEACPVCGSFSHPMPAHSDPAEERAQGETNFEQEIARAKERIAKLSTILAQTGKAVSVERQKVTAAKETAAAAKQQLALALVELDKVRNEYIEARKIADNALEILKESLVAAGQKIAAGLTAEDALKLVRAVSEYISNQDKVTENLTQQLGKDRQEQEACLLEISRLQRFVQEEEAELAAISARIGGVNEQLIAKKQELFAVTNGVPVTELLAHTKQRLERIGLEEVRARDELDKALAAVANSEQVKTRTETSWLEAAERKTSLEAKLDDKLKEEGFMAAATLTDALMPPEQQDECRLLLKDYAETEQRLIAQYEQLDSSRNGRAITVAEWEETQRSLLEAEAAKSAATKERVEAEKEYRDLAVKHQRWSQLEGKRCELKEEKDCLQALRTLLRGNVFVEFLAQEQMLLVARQASDRLKQITQQRYALELSSDGGFLIRDDANGGVKRPVSTLSGGETFQTSLALSLSLSTQIQLKGKYPLEFFFLDEGFGSLDQHALDVAMSTLEKLHIENLTIGVISHVSELKQRMPRRLIVEPAEPAGRGSRVRMEEA